MDVGAFSASLKKVISVDETEGLNPVIEKLRDTDKVLREVARKLDLMAERSEILKIEVKTLRAYVHRAINQLIDDIEERAKKQPNGG